MAKRNVPDVIHVVGGNAVEKEAFKYMKAAARRFKRNHQCTEDECSFCNGFTWGAVQGYVTGYRARKRATRR